MSASLAINEKPSPVVSAPLLNGTLDPLMHVMADRSISIDVLVLIQVIVSEYLWSVFSASKVARCFMNIWHSLPIPPFVPNTNGVKTPCSTLSTLSRYSRFLLSSWLLKISCVDFRAWLEELTCVTLISKNAV